MLHPYTHAYIHTYIQIDNIHPHTHTYTYITHKLYNTHIHTYTTYTYTTYIHIHTQHTKRVYCLFATRLVLITFPRSREVITSTNNSLLWTEKARVITQKTHHVR